MMTLVYLQKNNNIRVYVKGASEVILENCTKLVSSNGEVMLNTPQKEQIKTNVIEKFASNNNIINKDQSLRTISMAYKDLAVS
jgi:magnesium-transporting ATPase (P-type)